MARCVLLNVLATVVIITKTMRPYLKRLNRSRPEDQTVIGICIRGVIAKKQIVRRSIVNAIMLCWLALLIAIAITATISHKTHKNNRMASIHLEKMSPIVT